MNTAHRFCVIEDGQDLVEYTLLLALVALVSFLIFQQTGAATQPIWAAGSAQLQNAVLQTS
jgi:Flp pilus assembly pilin Flp